MHTRPFHFAILIVLLTTIAAAPPVAGQAPAVPQSSQTSRLQCRYFDPAARGRSVRARTLTPARVTEMLIRRADPLPRWL